MTPVLRPRRPIRALALSILALSGLVGVSTAPSAAAQDVVGPGSVVSGQFDAGRAACWLLPTTPGSRWRVHLDGAEMVVSVGRGGCSDFIQDIGDHGGAPLDRHARLEFTAGGGAYIIKGQDVLARAAGYTLRIEQLPAGNGGRLLPPAGVVGSWLTAGWTPESVSSAPARAGEGLAPRTVFKDCEDVCPELVVVAAGSFTMGSPDGETGRTAQEGPRHPVAFDGPFAIGRHEVTFAEYDACVQAGGCSRRPNDHGWGRGRRPVVDVSWNDAMEYVAWLSEHTGQRYTLPSESEWEYAARAGTNTPWHTGRAILSDDANILNVFGKTVPVGSYPPNAFGLHDVHGNVWEWVLDCLDTGYIGAPNDGSAATSGACAASRMIRGGSFAHEPQHVRSAGRSASPQAERHPRIGFRVTRAL